MSFIPISVKTSEKPVWHFLGASESLQNNGRAILFRVINDGRISAALLIRNNDKVLSYLNVCAHAGLRLNGDKNAVFNRTGSHLYCRSHGAMFAPDSGLCVQGPCKGLSLIPLNVTEQDDKLFLTDEVYQFYD